MRSTISDDFLWKKLILESGNPIFVCPEAQVWGHHHHQHPDQECPLWQEYVQQMACLLLHMVNLSVYHHQHLGVFRYFWKSRWKIENVNWKKDFANFSWILLNLGKKNSQINYHIDGLKNKSRMKKGLEINSNLNQIFFIFLMKKCCCFFTSFSITKYFIFL